MVKIKKMRIFFILPLVLLGACYDDDNLDPSHLLGKEDKHIVSKKKIKIKKHPYAYNSGMVECPTGGYYLAFRDDSEVGSELTRISKMGIVELDENFSRAKDSKVKILELGSKTARNPHLFWFQDELYVTYNDFSKVKGFKEFRRVYIAKLNPDLKVLGNTELLSQRKGHEKNWTPFDYFDGERHRFLLSYTLHQHKVLEYDLVQGQCEEFAFSDQPLPWTHGEVRGGTPAVFDEDRQEYVAFFHSHIVKEGKRKYFMGAYTFDPKQNFRITSMSRRPISFEGIYNSPLRGEAVNCREHCGNKNIVFPVGVVLTANNDGKKIFHVSLGENDSKTKVVTFDAEKLYKSLQTIKTDIREEEG